MGLDFVLQVVIWKFQNMREEFQKLFVDGFGEIVVESFNFVYEWEKIFGGVFLQIVLVVFVLVELFDVIRGCVVFLSIKLV